jgi:phage repressor protein C with HTH and peptisase S24 domain
LGGRKKPRPNVDRDLERFDLLNCVLRAALEGCSERCAFVRSENLAHVFEQLLERPSARYIGRQPVGGIWIDVRANLSWQNAKFDRLRHMASPLAWNAKIAIQPRPYVLRLAPKRPGLPLPNFVQPLREPSLSTRKVDRLLQRFEPHGHNRSRHLHSRDSTLVDSDESTSVVAGHQQSLYGRPMAVGSRLKIAMKVRGVKQADLARLASVDEATISALIKRDSAKSEYTGALARALRVSTDWLSDGKGQMELLSVSEDLPDNKYYFVSRYEAIGGLGAGRHNEQHVEISGTHAYRRDWILKNGWRPETLAVIDAEGPSMAPTVNDGDVVLINTDDVKIKSGEIYAIEDRDQGTRIKRLFRQLDGRVRVVSDNPDKRLYPDDYLTPDTGARIVGRVVHRSGSI